MTCRSAFVAVLLAASIGLGPAAAETAAVDPFTDLNILFRQDYAAARTLTLAASEPIIVVHFDELVLVNGGIRTAETFTPPLYHQMKAVAHLPLGLFTVLGPHADQPLGDGVIAALAALRAKIVAAAASFEGRPDWTPAMLANNRSIVAASLDLIDRATADRRVSGEALHAFGHALRPLILANVDVAAKAQLDGLNALVGKWRAALGEAAWAKLNVMVLAPRQARHGNLQYTYFLRLMGNDAEDRNLFYGENLGTVDDALQLLGTILLDRGAGITFFDSTTRLERDLLSDAAAAAVKELALPGPAK